MIKACIFDLDGTLADTLDSLAVVANGVMRDFGLRELPRENFKSYAGEGATMLVKRCLRDAGNASELEGRRSVSWRMHEQTAGGNS